MERLHEDGFEVEVLKHLSAPAGLDVGARTPQEIALSIFSEILTHYRGGRSTGRPLVEVKGARVSDQGVEVGGEPVVTERSPR
jgi:xanthine dehydrogenase accessory factor